MEENLRELQLLPAPTSNPLSPWKSDSSGRSRPKAGDSFDKPSMNLQLTISLQPLESSSSSSDYFLAKEMDLSGVKELKWEAKEQIRQAAAEKAYAGQVREMARREMELAQLELVRARIMWEQARKEVEKAERLKETATRHINSSCMEITCQACWRRFSP